MRGQNVPLRIQAQFLRHPQACAPAGAMLGFVMPDSAVNPSKDEQTPPASGWLQADVKRAINAAKKAGLESYRVEIAPNGTISIVVGQQT